MEDLKQQVLNDLNTQKEKELQEIREKNSKLKEIILYTRKDNPTCDIYKKQLKEQNIKFKEKDISIHPEVISTVQLNSVPIISVNGEYLVQGRDFMNPNQCIKALQYFADPEYIIPPLDLSLREQLKNINNNLTKTLNNLNRQLQPIVKLMNDIVQEENNEKKDK